MDFIKLDATVRATKGKGAARRMRTAGFVPAVIYGKSTNNTPISVNPEALVKALAGPLRVNTPLNLSITEVDGKKAADSLAIVKDHQYDPVTRELLHVDFLAITEDKQIRVDVPVEKSGRSVGEQMGGILRMVHRTVPVLCLPKDIPAKIAIDVSALQAGITFHVHEMTLSEGLSIDLPPQEAIITISAVAAEETKEGEEDKKASKK
ncbi:MAG: 50S ribosomal protein L25 [Deltaproteobacteria bacterium]|nr:50S ribosomal protein L25 [Deltaproteobacteria bacterium]MBN2673431.1 50S ribosomal protein L25 [Deltaproteobacteria bacterium]